MQSRHGDWVAFYWRFAGGRAESRSRRDAWKVFPLDDKHVPLILRLVAGGGLVFPQHAEVLDLLFDLLPATNGNAAVHANLLDAALARLASDPAVPGRFQMLARVERSSLTTNRPDFAGEPPRAEKTPASPQEQADKPRRGRKPRAGGAAPGDVTRMNLRFD